MSHGFTAPADDVEELADRYLHRPLAQPLVRLLSPTSVTPNQVTLLSGVAGVLSAAAIAASVSRPALRLAAAILLLASAVLDCADGQLARARGQSSPQGSALDGIADEIVGFTVILASAFVLSRYYGDGAWLVGVVALISSAVQCLVFDAAKERYVAQFGLAHGGSKLALADAPDLAPVGATAAAGALARIFEGYVTRVRWLGLQISFDQRIGPETARRRMRIWAMLGLGTHLACGYAALAISSVWLPALYGCLLIFALVMNGALAWLVLRDGRK